MDIVIPVRERGNGDRDSDELRYALRSFAAHLDHEMVWLVGGATRGLTGVQHLPTDQTGSKWENTKNNLRTALDDPRVSDPFIYANDDMFALRPVSWVPNYTLGTLQQFISAQRYRSDYVRSAERTRDVLAAMGYPEPWCFEVHTPMVVSKAGMSDALDVCRVDSRLYERTIYGALCGPMATEQIVDVKVYRSMDPIPSGNWVSTTELSFARCPVGKMIRDRFSSPCRYEEEQ